ncbi:MAG: hypothetical protein J7M29_12845 [Verrucomicrobia bacterium]|nr:hypothetical protein [Verrucomicrobiota bacterium]
MDILRQSPTLHRVAGREKVVIAPGWEALLRACSLDSVQAAYAVLAGETITRSGSSEVRRLELSDGRERRVVFLKKYWANNFRQAWKGALRGAFFGRSKVRREFENLARLRAWGLDAPAPAAYGEERRAGWLRRSFLISESAPEALPLDLFIRDLLPRLSPEEQRRQRRELIESLARMVRRLHAHGFVHHDLFWRNILLSGRKLDRFYLIDAHKGRRWFPLTGPLARARDLAALDAPAPGWFRRSERLRFLLRYLEKPRLDSAGRRLARRILRLAEPLRAKERRRVLEGRRIRPREEGFTQRGK